MSGLQRICRTYGNIKAKDQYGNKVTWLWDYVNEKARLKTEMSKKEIEASEKAKWMKIKEQLSKP